MLIIKEYDLLPNFAGEYLTLSEEEIEKIIKNSIRDEEIVEAVFIPRVNVIFVIYGNSFSRVIFVAKEMSMNFENMNTLTLDNLNKFSFDNFSTKEIRNEDYDTIADGLSAIIQIKVKNDNE